MNSPTFNTLDNRFENLNPDSSRIHYGGLGQTGDRDEVVQNVFTNSTWPGLKNYDSCDSAKGLEDVPRLASPNTLEMKDPIEDVKQSMQSQNTSAGRAEGGANFSHHDSFAS